MDPQPTALCYVKTLPGLSFCWLFVEPSVFGPASETSKNGDAADGNVPDWKVMFEHPFKRQGNISDRKSSLLNTGNVSSPCSHFFRKIMSI